MIGIYWQYLLGIHDMVFGLWSYETSRSDSLFGGLDLQFGQSHGGLHPLDRSRRRVWIEAEAKPQCWRSVDAWAVARHLIYSDILSGIISGIPSGIYSDILSGTRGWGAVPREIWRRRLRSEAVPSGFGSSGSAHWDRELAVEHAKLVGGSREKIHHFPNIPDLPLFR